MIGLDPRDPESAVYVKVIEMWKMALSPCESLPTCVQMTEALTRKDPFGPKWDNLHIKVTITTIYDITFKCNASGMN